MGKLANAGKLAVAQVFQTVERMDAIVNAMTGLGGVRDKGAQVRVDTARVPLTSPEKDILGRYDGYAVSWFERLSGEATLTGWDIKVGADVLQQFEEVERRLKITKTMRLALRGALKDGASLILMVTKGSGNLSQPLKLGKVKDLQALHIFDECEFNVAEYENDFRDPNYREAKFWQIHPQANGSFSAPQSAAGDIFSKGQKVHHSRCIYIPGRELSHRLRHINQGKDDSYLDSAWDALKDMLAIDQGGAVLAQEMKQDVIRMGGLEAVDAGALGDVMRDRMKTIIAGKGLLGMIVLAEDDVYESRAATTTGYKDLKAGGKSTFSAVSGQPEVVAFGATPGGLNTDGEAGRRSQDRTVATVQKTHLKGPLEKLYTVIIASMKEEIGTWRIEFRPLGTLTETEKAETRNKNAQTDRIYRQEGVLSPEHIRNSRFGEDGYQDIQPVETVEEVPTDPSRAFQGPQSRTVLEVVLQVATKNLPRSAGIGHLVHLFNIDPDAAEEIMGEVGTSFFVEVLPEPAPDVKTSAEDLSVQGGKDD